MAEISLSKIGQEVIFYWIIAAFESCREVRFWSDNWYIYKGANYAQEKCRLSKIILPDDRLSVFAAWFIYLYIELVERTNLNSVFQMNWLEIDFIRIRWIIGEIRVLKENLFVMSEHLRNHHRGMPWLIIDRFCDGMESIAEELNMRYENIFRILVEHDRTHLFGRLELF